ncbi:TIR domain-containing protein [Micromonospora humida]|uniref:TIR domain-containing protein n=1 Tax=Micromonospora humida TaxID=2809018 RepID=A0ABS2IUC1_9ACTN|nr:TIR domain-containing protein [Micromonospora humida]MBM7077940.1 TIR domain-containing protein [Micromonospora humida]
MPSTSAASYEVFISYNSGDAVEVEQIAHTLVDRGLRVFLDRWSLVPGEPWQEELERALDASAACAVMIGSAGPGVWQREELRAAIEDRVRHPEYRVIPVFLPGVAPVPDSLPRFLRRSLACTFTKIDDTVALSRLIAGIRGEQPGPTPSGRRADYAIPGRGESMPLRTALGVERLTWSRTGVLHEAREAYRRAALPILLHGLSGMGKTVLACHLVEELFAGDGRDLLVVPAAQSSAAGLQQAITHIDAFLAGRGGPDRRAAGYRGPLRELLRALLDELVERNVVVVLDSVTLVEHGWELELVDRLAGAPGVVLVVTSTRRPAPGHQLHAIAVPPLSRAESIAFIGHYVTLHRIALEPEWIVGRLNAALLSSPIALRALLSRAQSTLTSLLVVEAPVLACTPQRLVADLIADLDPVDREALAFADVVTGTPVEHLTRTAVRMPHGFGDSVRRLVECCLLHVVGDALDVPDLVADALARTDPDRRGAVATVVVAQIVESGQDPRCPMDVVASVCATVASRAAANGDWRLVDALCQDALLERINVHGCWKEYLLLLRLLVEAADRVDSRPGRIDLRFQLLRKLAQTHDRSGAWDVLREVEMLIADSVSERRAEFLSHRGFLNHLERDEDAALSDLMASLKLHTEKRNRSGLLMVNKLLGNHYLGLHRHVEAVPYYEIALNLAAEPDDVKQRLEIEASMAMCEMRIGGPEKAERRLRRVIDELRDRGFVSELGRALLNLTVVLEAQGRWAEARATALYGARVAVPNTAVAAVVQAVADRLGRRARAGGTNLEQA